MPSSSTGALLRDVARLHTHLQRLCVSCCEGTTVTQCTVLTELSPSPNLNVISFASEPMLIWPQHVRGDA